MKTYFGNNPLPLWAGIVPFFTTPNTALPTMLIEGNAVLNESWHGNGGRLFSGRAYALLMSQLKAGKLTPNRLINNQLEFPYGEQHYLIGGFFWNYLAQQYGLEKTNQFYINSSRHFINPFQTNKVFIRHFGIDFYQAVEAFIQYYSDDVSQYQPLTGTEIANSQNFTPLNHNATQLYFITRDYKSAPVLHQINRSTQSHSTQSGNWLPGKPFSYQNKIVTATAGQASPEKIVQGLFDSHGLLISGTEDRAYQSANAQGALWFDIPHSFDQPKLMRSASVTDQHNKEHSTTPEFIDTVNSSAYLSEEGKVYYFKQQGKNRILYGENRQLMQFNGYYSFVVHANKMGQVWFIGPSPFGSTLYRWGNGTLTRLSHADNIIDARPLNDGSWIAATIEADGFYYRQFAPTPERLTQPIFERRFHFEEGSPRNQLALPQHTAAKTAPITSTAATELKPITSIPDQPQTNNTAKRYTMLAQTRFSSFTPQAAYSSNYGVTFNLRANFTDPLLYHQFALFALRDTDGDIAAGGEYLNSRNRLEYGATLYGINTKQQSSESRDYGGELFLQYLLFTQGYHASQVRLRGYMDDEINDKNPATLAINYQYHYSQPLRIFANNAHQFQLFSKWDRSDKFIGASTSLFTALPNDFFLGVNGKYVDSTTQALTSARGIRFSNNAQSLNSDVTDFEMPGLSDSFFAKSGWQAGGTIKKQFDFSCYYFTFPLSLRREAIYVNANHYEAANTNNITTAFDEGTVGITLDLLLLNKYDLPLSIEYIRHQGVTNNNSVRVLFDLL